MWCFFFFNRLHFLLVIFLHFLVVVFVFCVILSKEKRKDRHLVLEAEGGWEFEWSMATQGFWEMWREAERQEPTWKSGWQHRGKGRKQAKVLRTGREEGVDRMLAPAWHRAPGALGTRRLAAFPYIEVSTWILLYLSWEEELLLLPFYRWKKRLKKASRIFRRAKSARPTALGHTILFETREACWLVIPVWRGMFLKDQPGASHLAGLWSQPSACGPSVEL